MADLYKQLQGFQLTTADILYHLPDYPDILQSFLWQDYDRAPQFPVFKDFLSFWDKKIEGKVHSVHLTATDLITPGDIEFPNIDIIWH